MILNPAFQRLLFLDSRSITSLRTYSAQAVCDRSLQAWKACGIVLIGFELAVAVMQRLSVLTNHCRTVTGLSEPSSTRVCFLVSGVVLELWMRVLVVIRVHQIHASIDNVLNTFPQISQSRMNNRHCIEKCVRVLALR